MKKTKCSVKVSEVVYEQKYYPRSKPSTSTREAYADAMRAGNEFPPIEVDADGLVLLDGYHRWKAAEDIGRETIDAYRVELNGTPRLLYAAHCNSIHGDRLTRGEKKEVAREMATAGVDQKQIAELLNVSQPAISEWTSDIVKRKAMEAKAMAWWLSRLGWTQGEIAERIGKDRTTASRYMCEISELIERTLRQQSIGRTSLEIAESEHLTEALVDVLLLDGKDDVERMGELKIGVQPYDVWSFWGCDPRFGAPYPGRVPGELVLHVLYFFTKPGGLVVDPMAGSGTTIDACAYLGRKVYGYDAHPAEDRGDILEHDLAQQGWPDKVKKAKLVFWDPPYFKKKDDGYGEKSISRLDRDEYLAFFHDAAKQLKKLSNAKMAFLCSDYDGDEGDIFFWDYVRLFECAGWKPIRRIQVPLGTQQVHADIVNKFRKQRRLARLGRDLVILQ